MPTKSSTSRRATTNAPAAAAPTATTILTILGGGVAVYKVLEVLRSLRAAGYQCPTILTAGAEKFISPLLVSSLTGQKCYTDLWSLTDELEMGHIQLARAANLVLVAPATANLMARMAHGHADDLATTVLLATQAKLLLAPAMNPAMWAHAATQANAALLTARGASLLPPAAGLMACGESGDGRLPEPAAITAMIEAVLACPTPQALAGQHVLITAGPTQEPLDPIRYLGNRSSGRQGFALAAAALAAGARVTLVSGPTQLTPPPGVTYMPVTTAQAMLSAVCAHLPATVFLAAAAVADWQAPKPSAHKLKKQSGAVPALRLTTTPDILATISQLPVNERPRCVIGFAAETEQHLPHARKKLQQKSCDALVLNDASSAMGSLDNQIWWITQHQTTAWPRQSKVQVAGKIMTQIAAMLDVGKNPLSTLTQPTRRRG